jgi:hypothetical protein
MDSRSTGRSNERNSASAHWLLFESGDERAPFSVRISHRRAPLGLNDSRSLKLFSLTE